MKNIIFSFLLFLFLFRLPLFAQNNIASNTLNKPFSKVQALAKNRSAALFSVFNQALSDDEENALKFLYSYMPLCDLADYSGEYFLKIVRSSLEAKKYFNWGKTIPNDIFQHFVLPPRVNNESLDTSRILFFQEIKDRIKNLTIAEAALEVNRWCREKVTYRGTDARTRSPLAVMSCAYGRCGEESTFTVSALRAVGIPARQCYTPRWAHSDDNHAWVEVWVDGKWYFMGACEPEAGLNMGWFAEPATRAMMIHTLVIGDYKGPEEVLLKDEKYTRINVLSNYAPVKNIVVRVLSQDQKAVDNATVNFSLYNYAEFYPIATKKTNASGFCSLTTGFGELLIWCNKNNSFGFEKFTIRNQDTLTVVLNKSEKSNSVLSFDFVPPTAGKPPLAPVSGDNATNAQRVMEADKIRGKYEHTFIDSLQSVNFAHEKNLNADSTLLYLRKSRGNWKTIYSFLESTPADKRNLVLLLLSSINDKDLADISLSVLNDHLLNAPLQGNYSPSFYAQFLLSPRLEYEQLLPWRAFLKVQFSKYLKGNNEKTISLIKKWTTKNIHLDEKWNYYKVPLTPSGVFNLRIADEKSRNIFVTALCRTFSIPARIEPSTKKPQYFSMNEWKDFYPAEKTNSVSAKAALVIQTDNRQVKNPEYYVNFTIEKFENGTYRTLDFEEDPRLKVFPCTLSLDPGSYLCVTGIRKNDGSVLSRLEFFELKADSTKILPLVFRNKSGSGAVIGNIELNKKAQMNGTSQPMPLKNMLGEEGTFFIWADADKEPTRHVAADLSKIKTTLNEWNGKFVFLFKSKTDLENFKNKNAADLPSSTLFAVDNGEALNSLKMVVCKSTAGNLPIIIYTNKQGEIFYHSEGYVIGTDRFVLDLIGK
ncbi:MAG: transglutaminase-like domain-containing protein [Bacteroidota bacterium]